MDLSTLVRQQQLTNSFSVSDSCSNGVAIDTSGPKLRDLVNEHFSGVSKIEYEIIPDDLATIEVSTFCSVISSIDSIQIQSECFCFSHQTDDTIEILRCDEIEFNFDYWRHWIQPA